MKNANDMSSTGRSGLELILIGLVLALLGAGSVMFMVIGVSCLYVGQYGLAIMDLGGFVLCGGIFLKTYGSYLVRLEQRAPMDSSIDPSRHDTTMSEPTSAVPELQVSETLAEPLATNLVVSIAIAAYGLLIVGCGLIWTRGVDMILNLLAGGALLVSAAMVWKLGQPGNQSAMD